MLNTMQSKSHHGRIDGTTAKGGTRGPAGSAGSRADGTAAGRLSSDPGSPAGAHHATRPTFRSAVSLARDLADKTGKAQVVMQVRPGLYTIRPHDPGRAVRLRALLVTPSRRPQDGPVQSDESDARGVSSPKPDRRSSSLHRRIVRLAGSSAAAKAWMIGFPIPGFGGKTADTLIREGKADWVSDYIDAVEAGTYA